MVPDDADHDATVFDYATRTIFEDPAANQARAEVDRSLRELVESFGERLVMQSLLNTAIAGKIAMGEERSLQIMRQVSILVMDSAQPRLCAKLIGILGGIEVVAHRKVHLAHLCRDYGISKQAVSKMLAELADRLQVPRPLSSPAARQSYRLMNRRNRTNGHAHTAAVA